MKTVGIIGLGYVGLPLSEVFLRAGRTVYGFDVDPAKIACIESGTPYINHFDFELLKQHVDADKFRPTSDLTRLGEPDCLLICVPTPLNDSRDPDLTYVEKTGESIAKTLRAGQLVVLESTTYPGTTRDVLRPILDRSGLTLGQDYFLAYSPEREDPGNRDFGTKNIPKVVGGMNQESTRLATELYRSSVDSIVAVENCEIAEACKILENTYRSVNIAMVNELKLLFDRLDIDIWKVIEAAKTKPFGFQAFYPGPGLGGHCIPIDPFYLTWLARRHEMSTRFIELAGEINTSMPDYVVSKVTDALNSCCKSVRGSRIGVLGIAYKKDIDDHRESPSFKIIEQLHAKGAELSYSDPHVSSIRKTRSVDVPVLPNCPLTAEYLSSLDACVIATDHTAFDYLLIAKHAKLIIDTRNAMHRIDCRVGQVWKA